MPSIVQCFGIDFSSAPTRRKPIVVASGLIEPGRGSDRNDSARLRVVSIDPIDTLAGFDEWLRRSGPWLGGFDFPFGLPRGLLANWAWDDQPWCEVTQRVAAMTHAELVDALRRYCAARPAGAKFAHRATDGPAGSSPSMKWVNPPVALMLRTGAPRLLAAGLHLPGLYEGDRGRIALEAYPGMLARALIGRVSYKSDAAARADPARRERRARIVAALARGSSPLGIAVHLPADLHERCVDDGRGDSLDAVLCAAQAAWGALRANQGWGLPATIDPLEGWIVGAMPAIKPGAPP